MEYEANTVQSLYKGLVSFYPRSFREELGESMAQTFNDLCHEKQKSKQELLGFALWTFIETAVGILREHLVLISPGVVMQTMLKTGGSSALISLLLILPFIIMEVVNRRQFNEDFPFVLFFALWLNLCATSLILLPILRARQTGAHDMVKHIPAQGNTLLTNPRSALVISIILFLAPGILPLLDSLGWLSLDRLFNGPNPEVDYFPGMFMSIGLILFPIAAGIVAGRPIVGTLQAGGRLFAHPIHLIIVIVLSFLFASGVITLIVDQWPCFIGVPVCD
jgi:hypothetical protein